VLWEWTPGFLSSCSAYVFTTEPGAEVLKEGPGERFIFLFVGGTLHRKGIDISWKPTCALFSAYMRSAWSSRTRGPTPSTEDRRTGEDPRSHQRSQQTLPSFNLEDDLPASHWPDCLPPPTAWCSPIEAKGSVCPHWRPLSCGIPVWF